MMAILKMEMDAVSIANRKEVTFAMEEALQIKIRATNIVVTVGTCL